MNQIKAYISTFVSIVILTATLLPALHSFDHINSFKKDYKLTDAFNKASTDCELCDYHLASIDAPQTFSYEIYSPQKETVYSISLAETVNLFPNPLFSLRAPPVI